MEPSSFRVVVVMATYSPEPVLFHRQLGSLARQTESDFLCVIHDDATPRREATAGVAELVRTAVGDDPRFVVIAHAENVGFYRNFERGLRHARQLDAPYVSLADQDDAWYPTKLALTLEHLEHSGAALACTDVVPVRADRTQLGRPFFARRHPTTRSVLDLTLMNSAIGATAVMRVGLLDLALPFPPERPRSFHDHWLARCAQFAGGLAHLPSVTMEYVQHATNIQGFTSTRHQLRDFFAAARESHPDQFADDQQLVADRLAELRELALRVESRQPGGADRLQPAIDLHAAVLAGSRRAMARVMLMWWRDQHLRTRPRHEHVEIRYVRATVCSRAAGKVPADVA